MAPAVVSAAEHAASTFASRREGVSASERLLLRLSLLSALLATRAEASEGDDAFDVPAPGDAFASHLLAVVDRAHASSTSSPLPEPRAKVAQKTSGVARWGDSTAAGVDATAAAEFALVAIANAADEPGVPGYGALLAPGPPFGPPRATASTDVESHLLETAVAVMHQLVTPAEKEKEKAKDTERDARRSPSLSSSSSSSSLIVPGERRPSSRGEVVFDGQHEVNRTVNTSASASLPRVSRLSPRSTRRVATRGRERSPTCWRILVARNPPRLVARRENYFSWWLVRAMRTTPRATPPRSRTRATVLNPPRSRVPVRGSWTSLRTRRRWRRRPRWRRRRRWRRRARKVGARSSRRGPKSSRASRDSRRGYPRRRNWTRSSFSRAPRRRGDAEMSVTGAGKIRVSRVARLEENEAGKCPGVDDACPSLERIVDEFDRFARCFILGSPSAAVRAAAAATARAAWRSASAGSNARRRASRRRSSTNYCRRRREANAPPRRSNSRGGCCVRPGTAWMMPWRRWSRRRARARRRRR